LTYDKLTSGNEDFNNFLFDVEIINKADCNITFGIGGPFNLLRHFQKEIFHLYLFINYQYL
jgi:hypothetical protein